MSTVNKQKRRVPKKSELPADLMTTQYVANQLGVTRQTVMNGVNTHSLGVRVYASPARSYVALTVKEVQELAKLLQVGCGRPAEAKANG